MTAPVEAGVMYPVAGTGATQKSRAAGPAQRATSDEPAGLIIRLAAKMVATSGILLLVGGRREGSSERRGENVGIEPPFGRRDGHSSSFR